MQCILNTVILTILSKRITIVYYLYVAISTIYLNLNLSILFFWVNRKWHFYTSRLASGKYSVRCKRMKFTYRLVLQSFISILCLFLCLLYLLGPHGCNLPIKIIIIMIISFKNHCVIGTVPRYNWNIAKSCVKHHSPKPVIYQNVSGHVT